MKNYGFIKPVIESDHKVLGSANDIPTTSVIFPDGHGWLAFQSPIEMQNVNGVESYNCSAYGTHDAIQPIMKQAGLVPEPDYAERYTGIIAETKPTGNDPHTVAEAIRTGGMIPQAMLPFSDLILSIADYFSFKGAVESVCIAAARLWVVRYSLSHAWLWNGDIPVEQKQQIIKTTLQTSTVGASVFAWQQDVNGLYFKNPGDEDNHWIAILDYVDGVKWIVRDSYPDGTSSEIKELRWDFDFGFAKKYCVIPTGNKGTISAQSFSLKVANFFKSLFKI